MKRFLVMVMLAVIANAAYSQTGIVRELSGEVGLKNAGAADFVPAQRGSVVAQNTIISTGFRSTAVIEVGNSTITVQPLTRLTLAEISKRAGTENLNVNLQTGRVKVDVKPPAGARVNTTVQTPSATASVRGTSFEMDARSIKTTDGKVSYAGKNGLAVMVSGGSESAVSDNGESAIDPEMLAASEFESIPRKKTASSSGVFGIKVIVE